MTSPLAPTFGVWLTFTWLQAFLQGCGMLQGWLYFHWYKNDGWQLRTMVATLLVIETAQIIIFFQITYVYFIDDFGNIPALLTIHWQDSIELFLTYLSAFIVQMYFGYCIYALDRKNKILPAIIVALSLTQISSGIAQTIKTIRLSSFAELNSTKAITTVEAAAAFLCDIVITGALVYNLGSRKGRVRTTNRILDRLMIYAINRGMLTAICALLNLILFLAIPGTFYFFIGLAPSGKLYMNSALATLNSRQHTVNTARDKAGSSDWNFNSIPMNSGAISATAVRGATDPRVHVVVTKQTDGEGSDTFDYAKSTFMDGML